MTKVSNRLGLHRILYEYNQKKSEGCEQEDYKVN